MIADLGWGDGVEFQYCIDAQYHCVPICTGFHESTKIPVNCEKLASIFSAIEQQSA